MGGGGSGRRVGVGVGSGEWGAEGWRGNAKWGWVCRNGCVMKSGVGCGGAEGCITHSPAFGGCYPSYFHLPQEIEQPLPPATVSGSGRK